MVENIISLFIHAVTSLHCEPLFGGVLYSEEIRLFMGSEDGVGL